MNKKLLNAVLRQFIPNVGTLLLGALLLFAYRAWAAPGAARDAARDAAPETTPEVMQAPQAAPAAQGATPGTLSYQGELKTAGGQRVNGSVNITFRIYNTPTGATSQALWREVHTGANAVPVSNGLFNVHLGSLTPIPASVWSNATLYLGIQAGSDAEMSPREVVGQVPYAAWAARSQFGGSPNSYPYVLHWGMFATRMENFCYGYVPGDPGASGNCADASMTPLKKPAR